MTVSVRHRHRALTGVLGVVLLTFAAATCGKDEPGPVNPPGATASISLLPTTVIFVDTAGTSSPGAKMVAITNTGTGTLGGLAVGTITYGSGAQGWLSATLSATEAPSNLSLTPTNSGLAPGSYTATVPVTSTSATNSPQSITVTYTLEDAPPPPPAGQNIVLTATGNLGSCNGSLGKASADVVAAANPDYVFLLGDLVDPQTGLVATLQDFLTCFEPSWGRFKSKTIVAMGDNEVDGDTLSPTAGLALGADAYFGPQHAGPPGKNYWSFNLGKWHVIVLNVQSGGPTRPKNIRYNAGSEQLDWLYDDLRANRNTKCTLAVWQNPMWMSSSYPPTPTDPYPNRGYRHQPVRGVWTVLYEGGADLVLNGGNHIYERFAPMRYDKSYREPTKSEFAADSVRGIRQITTGLGGDGPLESPTFVINHPLSEYQSGGNGVLKVTLGDSTYTWQFLNTRWSNIRDSGTGKCH